MGIVNHEENTRPRWHYRPEKNEVFIAVDVSAVEAMVNGRWLSGRIYPIK